MVVGFGPKGMPGRMCDSLNHVALSDVDVSGRTRPILPTLTFFKITSEWTFLKGSLFAGNSIF